MKYALLLLLGTVACFGQTVGQEMQNGTIRAQLDTYPADSEGFVVRVATVSTDPGTIGFDITIVFSVSGVIEVRSASQQCLKDQRMWVAQYFTLPLDARVIAFGVLERKRPTMFSLDERSHARSSALR